MSTVHHSPYWPAERSQALSQTVVITGTKGEDAIRSAYCAKDLTRQFTLLFSSIAIGSINEKMGLIAKEHIGRVRRGEATLSNPLGIFFCNPRKEMGICLEEMKESFSSQKLKKVSYEQRKLLETLGITQSGLKALYPKVEELVQGCFNSMVGNGAVLVFGGEQTKNHFLFSKDMKGDEIFQWAQETTLLGMQYVYEMMGFVRIGPVSIPEETAQALQLDQEKMNKMSCFQWALAVLDPETAKAFSSGKYREDAELELCLTDSGWHPVQNPDTGDLVVYYNHITKRVVHAGVFEESGRVRSKLGINNPVIYDHGLLDVLGLYGTSVYFMRKSTAKLY